MITIEQLLESVDLDFEPRWVTKDSDEEDGCICAWDTKPTKKLTYWQKTDSKKDKWAIIGYIKAAEFADKDWSECIYEVPRKTTGKIEKLEMQEIHHSGEHLVLRTEMKPATPYDMHLKINELVDAVNELKGE